MEDKKSSEIKIEIDEQTANGIYSNLAVISHSESEFVMDFIFFHPQNPKNKVRARIITSPAHAKKMMLALKDNVAKFESKFGEIKEAALPIPKAKTEYYN